MLGEITKVWEKEKGMGVIIDKDAKHLWQRLVSEELKHKLRLEMFYDDFFYGED